MDKRIDLYTALLVDTVLQAAAREGLSVSAKAFERLGLPFELAKRLSGNASERRALKCATKHKALKQC